MRLIIIAVLVYLIYNGLKSWMMPKRMPGDRKADPSASGELDDMMVKDPWCGVYFPKHSGFRLDFEGKELYFCSEDCRDKFSAMHKKDH